MKYRRLGVTGLNVSPLCLGVAFRGFPTRGRTEQDCVATIERAVERGCNFIDCANFYGRGTSEELLGRTLRRLTNRHELIITSKVGSPMGDGANERGLSRTHIMAQIEASLRRLQLDFVDVYLLHRPDPYTPLQDTLQAMDDIVRQGKARFVGISNYAAAEVVENLWIADRCNLTVPSVLQYQYSLLHRWRPEGDIFPLCGRFGLGLMTYSPLAIGLLTGNIRTGRPLPADSHWNDHPDRDRVLATAEPVLAAVAAVAQRQQRTPAQVVLAWLLANPLLSAPIVGPELPAQVDELFDAIDWELPGAEKQLLDSVSAELFPPQLIHSAIPGRQRVPRR